jgi:RNA-directed DNA polymerase
MRLRPSGGSGSSRLRCTSLLDPKPGRTANFHRPTRILSFSKLSQAWQASRDATTQPGRPGIDGITAQQFAAKLDANLRALSKHLHSRTYGPARLRAVFIPKPNSSKERIICIPTVRDRVVQRAIIEYLVKNRKLPIYNSSSYGFIRGRGTQEAISRAVALRSEGKWCLKTDIEAFFDRIPRQYLKNRLASALPAHSLTPVICKIIDCEIKETPVIRSKLQKQGIKRGVGLRQGMPLSPILANLVLSKFDRAVERAGIEMIRYADDILLFFPSKEATLQGHQFVKSALESLGLRIPEIMEGSKTQIGAPDEPIDFLGREIVYVGSAGRTVARVSRNQIAKIKMQLEGEYTYQSRLKQGSNFQDTIVDMWRSIASYLGAYKDAYDYPVLDSELRASARKLMSDMFRDIFGDDALEMVTEEAKDFLGFGSLNFPQQALDLEF